MLGSLPVARQLDELPLLVSGVFSGSLPDQLEATMRFRKLLSIGAVQGHAGACMHARGG